MAEESLRETLSRAAELEPEKVEPEAVVENEVVVEPEKVEPEKVELEKVEPEKVEPEKVEAKKVEPEKVEAKKEKVEPAKGIRAPESWKPALREQHWSKLPVPVQAEIHRRERQIDEALQHTAEARRGQEQFNQLVTNYRDVFEFEKSPPLQSIANLLNISRALRFAPAPHKAQTMAQIIQGFGVDVKLLDQALSMLVSPDDPQAQQAQNQNQFIQQAINKEMEPVRQLMGGLQQQRAQAHQAGEQELKTEIDTFAADPKNEYFEVVRDVMADILEAGASRGQKISLQDAYQRAILANNDLAGQFSQRKLQEAATRLNTPAAQALQRAGLSVTGAPSGGGIRASTGSLRDDLEAAAQAHSGRG